MKLCHPIRNTEVEKKLDWEGVRRENKLGNKKFLKPNIQPEKNLNNWNKLQKYSSKYNIKAVL